MHWFELGQDFYSGSWLPTQFSWRIGIAILFFFLAFIGLHLLRRGLGAPSPGKQADVAPPPKAPAFERFELGGRLYHWANFAVLIGLLLSGFALFFPGIMPGIGPSWLWVHVVCAWVFIGFILLHILFAFLWARPRDMWAVGRHDWHDLGRSVRYYAGNVRTVARHGKFDVWQKIYHAFITLLSLIMVATGISLFISAMVLATLGADWMRENRLIHDVFAWVFFAAIVTHIYIRLLRLNRAKLVSMFTGRIPAAEFRRWHDWRLWRPKPEAELEPTKASGEDLKPLGRH